MDRIRAALFDHRRPLAAILATLAVLAGLQSLQPSDAGSPVVVAARDLRSGHVITASDLDVVDFPATARPSNVLSRADAVGRRVAGPVRAGEPMTDRRVIEPRDLSGHGDDAVLTMVRLDDPSVVAGLRVGDRVDVVASVVDAETPTRVVARGATIAILPRAERDSAPSVGVVTPRKDALDLASAALDARLGLLVTS